MSLDAKKYKEGVGRRKSSVARVRLEESGKPTILVNGKNLDSYFTVQELQQVVLSPLVDNKKYSVSAKVVGGGISSQAGAIRHGIARALIAIDENLRKDLKSAGFLKRDPRRKERKKYGLRKARRAPQWSKR